MSKHSAPPVTYPVRRSRLHFLVLLGAWCLGLLTSLQWLYSAQALGWRPLLSFFSVVTAGLFVYRYWSRLCGGELAWDGGGWVWQRQTADQQSVVVARSVSVTADFQHCLLIMLTDSFGNQRWLFVQRSVFPERWLDLRRAVYCSRKSPSRPIQIDTARDENALPVAVLSHDEANPSMRIDA